MTPTTTAATVPVDVTKGSQRRRRPDLVRRQHDARPASSSGAAPQFQITVHNTLERHGQPDLADRQLGRLRAGRAAARSRQHDARPDASFACTYTGTWTAGQNTNTAAATVSIHRRRGNTTSPSDSDDANYYGATVSVDVTKEVSVDGGLTWSDANTTPGPTLPSSGAAPQFQITVHNTSNVTVSLTSLTDSSAAFVLAACSPVAPGDARPRRQLRSAPTPAPGRPARTPTPPRPRSATPTPAATPPARPIPMTPTTTARPSRPTSPRKSGRRRPDLVRRQHDARPDAPRAVPRRSSRSLRPQHLERHGQPDSLTDSSAAFVLAACSPVAPATLAPDASFVCTYTGTWTAGQNTNTAAATVSHTDAGGNTTSPSDSDDANYYGATVSVDVTKAVSVDGGLTWSDANTTPGPTLLERCRAAVPDHRPQHLERHGQPDLADRQLGRLRAGCLQPGRAGDASPPTPASSALTPAPGRPARTPTPPRPRSATPTLAATPPARPIPMTPTTMARLSRSTSPWKSASTAA